MKIFDGAVIAGVQGNPSQFVDFRSSSGLIKP